MTFNYPRFYALLCLALAAGVVALFRHFIGG
jgi:hypothetical protein